MDGAEGDTLSAKPHPKTTGGATLVECPNNSRQTFKSFFFSQNHDTKSKLFFCDSPKIKISKKHSKTEI